MPIITKPKKSSEMQEHRPVHSLEAPAEAGQAAHTSRPSSPLNGNSTSASRPATPASRPSTPTSRPSTPASRPSTPASQPSTPVSQPSTSVSRPSMPAAHAGRSSSQLGRLIYLLNILNNCCMDVNDL